MIISRKTTSWLALCALVTALVTVVAGPATGQTSGVGYVAAVNGASTDPVNITVGSVDLGSFDYAADGGGTTVPEGPADVSFTGGSVDSTVAVNIGAGSAMTVVSGFGEDGETAAAYPIEVAPIDAGQAKYAVWNATTAAVTVAIDGGSPVDVAPGEGIAVTAVAAGTVSIDIDGVARDVDLAADSYTDVFAVSDGVTPAVAIAQVPSMTDLISAIGSEPSDVVVPDVVGQPEADAITAITDAGLAAASVQAADDTVPAGSVISQDPVAGTSVAAGSTVTLTISTGPGTVVVPDVSGQPAADAQAELEAQGFAVTTEEAASVDVEAGLVIDTNPAAGTEVAPGTTVVMTVSTGAGEAVVPDLFGMTVEEATAAGETAGLIVTIVPDPDDPDPDGLVVSQDPAAGATVEAGSEVLAQQAPDVDEAWAIVTLDDDRLLTISGINFLPGSNVDLSLVDTDRTATATVEDDGSWSASFDLSEVDNDTEFVQVSGTAADATEFEATFKIPAAGESTDEPTEEPAESGFPVWAWIVLVIALVAIGLIVYRMVAKGSGDTDAPSDA